MRAKVYQFGVKSCRGPVSSSWKEEMTVTALIPTKAISYELNIICRISRMLSFLGDRSKGSED
jgi:hypothetical protein